MAGVVLSGIVEFPPEVLDEALIKGKALIDGAYTEKGCIHYLWTADLNHPGRVVVYEEWKAVLTSKPTCREMVPKYVRPPGPVQHYQCRNEQVPRRR